MNLTSLLLSISTLLITESKFAPVLKLKYFGFFTGGPVTATVLSGKYSPVKINFPMTAISSNFNVHTTSPEFIGLI